ncbi:MAG: L,D-transpeptidase family protein [Pseudomonadota bacterium]
MRIAHANPNTTRPGATRPAVSFIAVLATLWALGTGAQAANELPVADRVLVDKSERWMRLYDGDEVLREFKISLGQEPEGDKRQEGDNKTPEGRYTLDVRNPDSDFFLSIRISYPSPSDAAAARAVGTDPGGQIMIHGQPNEPRYSPGFYASTDWTNGCIAVSNLAMIDIWLMTRPGTPIEIRP